MAEFSSRTYEQILTDVRAAREWYESIGIKTNDTRLELIERRICGVIQDISSLSLSREMVVERWDNPDTYYALNDGVAFGRIAREIGKVGPNLLPKKILRNLLEGPLSPLDEVSGDKSVNARNYFTELELAAYFSEKGIPSKGFDDLKFQFQGANFVVECKRLLSPSRVHENMDQACNQLKKNMVTKEHRGLIALAIEKVMELDKKKFVFEGREYLGECLDYEVYKLIEEFLKKFKPHWQKFDRRISGIIFICRFLYQLVKPSMISSAYIISFLDLNTVKVFGAKDYGKVFREKDSKQLRRLKSFLDGNLFESTEN